MAVNILNTENCALGGNLGAAPCNREPGIARYLVAVPRGTTIPAGSLTTVAAFNTYVNGKLFNDTPGLRWQMLPELSKFSDKSEPYKTINKDGRMIAVQRTPYVWEWELWNGSTGATKFIHSILVGKFQDKQAFYDFFIIDDNGAWWGEGLTPNTSTAALKAIRLSTLLISDWQQKKSDGADTNVYKILVSLLNNAQLNENFGSVIASTGDSYQSLTDVVMVAGTTASTTTHIYVNGNVANGMTTLGKWLNTGLDTNAFWSVLDSTNAAKTFTISGVSYNALLDQYDITGSWSASNTGDTVTVGLAGPTAGGLVTAGYYVVSDSPTNLYSYTAP